MRDALVGEPPSLVREWGECSADHLAALSARSEHQAPGSSPSPDPDMIKIDARNGDGLLMDYDVSLNMKAELTMVRRGVSDDCVSAFADPASCFQLQPYCGRPVEEVAYYMSLEQSPAGGLRLSHKQWIDIMKGKDFGNLERFPVPPEAREGVTRWLLGLNARLSTNEETKTLIQDVIDARFGRREEETDKGKGRAGSNSDPRRWTVLPLDSVRLEDLELD